jgi:hypothetical protein
LPFVVVLPPPSPAPPVVEVLPVPVGVVVVVEEVEDVEVVVVGVVVVVVVVVVGVVVVDVLLEDDVVVGIDCVVVPACRRQSVCASFAIVTAPWLRLLRNVGLIEIGRFWTSRFSAALALTAAPQLPDCTAALISLPWPLSDRDWSADSRPAPPPQAATHEAAKPSPPARMARGAKRIRGLTLEGQAVGVGLDPPYWPYARRSASESGRRAARIAAAAPAMS